MFLRECWFDSSLRHITAPDTKKPKIIVITGPTSSGKTSLAIRLAQERGGEVVSADSRQTYIGLNISTGKVTSEEMQSIPHYLIDIRHPSDALTLHEWRELATTAIKDILIRGKIPIIAGGTGFYINALINNSELPNVPANPELREQLNKKSTKHLVDTLATLDQDRLAVLDQKNRVRLIRAIEVATALGKVPPITYHPSPYEFEIITLLPDRAELKKIIEERTRQRIESGLLEEIQHVHDAMNVSWERLEELGFDQKYAAQYLQDKISKEDMERLIIRDNWRYAKRQYTWIQNQLL